MKTFPLVALTLAATLAATAHAADPIDGASYAGHTTQGDDYDVDLTVSQSGTRIARFAFDWRTPDCGRARNGAQGSIRVRWLRLSSDGTFRGSGTRREDIPRSRSFAGGTPVERYRIYGQFVSRDRARGNVRVTVTVLNRAGAVVDTCTMRRAARWSALRLGITDTGD